MFKAVTPMHDNLDIYAIITDERGETVASIEPWSSGVTSDGLDNAETTLQIVLAALNKAFDEGAWDRSLEAVTPQPEIPFRHLDEKEDEEFREWAREHFEPGKAASDLWHPTVREEWNKLQEGHNKR